MEMKQCADCGETKAVSEFYYQKHRDSYTKRCKKCRQAWLKSKPTYNNAEPPEHEQYIVNKLIGLGYPAQHGRDLKQFKYVDIVVYGCVRLEAKPLLPMTKRKDATNTGWAAATSHDQRKQGMRADVVCILFQDELYFFAPNHPAFYIDGELRKKILYNPFSRRKHLTDNRKLEMADMLAAHNQFKMLDQALKRWQTEQRKKASQPMLLPKAS